MLEPADDVNVPFSAGGHHIGSGQLRDLPTGRQTCEEPETKGPHDLRASLERRQGHSAVW